MSCWPAPFIEGIGKAYKYHRKYLPMVMKEQTLSKVLIILKVLARYDKSSRKYSKCTEKWWKYQKYSSFLFEVLKVSKMGGFGLKKLEIRKKTVLFLSQHVSAVLYVSALFFADSSSFLRLPSEPRLFICSILGFLIIIRAFYTVVASSWRSRFKLKLLSLIGVIFQLIPRVYIL